ncbi:MAG: hypothetical protein ABIJ08_05760 [Nanoarchaeota archaeon]
MDFNKCQLSPLAKRFVFDETHERALIMDQEKALETMAHIFNAHFIRLMHSLSFRELDDKKERNVIKNLINDIIKDCNCLKDGLRFHKEVKKIADNLLKEVTYLLDIISEKTTNADSFLAEVKNKVISYYGVLNSELQKIFNEKKELMQIIEEQRKAA